MNKMFAEPNRSAAEDSNPSAPEAVFPPLSDVRYQVAGGRWQVARVLLLLILAAAPAGWTQEAGTNAETATASSPKSRLSDLATMSLEDLTRLEVTSVSKHKEKLTDAPAAVYVITGEDIRRSGVTSIAEALRMAPGLEVARVDAHDWAITSRGFNELYANKLLVLIDGRSVYTPVFSGVQWDVQDTLLGDIDRIEVIRGPGAALWGANAVNGVINITTKSAKDTQGGNVSGGYGSEERGFGSARYGGKLGETGHYRAYVKYFNRDSSALPSGGQADDAWDMYRGGLRMDWDTSDHDLFTLQGDAYSGTENQTQIFFMPSAPFTNLAPNLTKVAGANVVGRWTHSFSEEAELHIQAYYDWTERQSPIFDERRHTGDLEAQLRHPLGERQDVTWGIGYRYTRSDIGSSNFTLAFSPMDRSTPIFNAFVQDAISVVRDRLRLTLGCKFENNVYTGFEFQPSARLLWTPHPQHSIWASVSRAVRTPSQAETGARIVITNVPPGPVFGSVNGNPAFQSEVLLAYELGYRIQPTEHLSLDLALFYNDYDHLRSVEPRPLDFSNPGYILAPNSFENMLKGQTYGGELAASFRAADWWRWRGAYSYLQTQLQPRAGSMDILSQAAEGDRHHQVSLSSSMDLPGHLQLDCTGRYVDSIPNLQIKSYITMDARLGWRATRNLELAIVGQNLLEDRHAEFTPSVLRFRATEVERAVYGKITFSF
jgi:iron complex outermembrane receptor protein